MTVQEFSRCAIRFVGTPVEWKPRLAHRLGVTLAEVEAWADGTAPVPAAVAAVLDPAAGPAAPPSDEWIKGTGLALTNEPARAYLVHARRPRFIARLVAGDDADGAGETAPTPERVLQLDAETWLAEVVWIDPEPRELGDLLVSAARALEAGARPH
jgi:hypothetical protein